MKINSELKNKQDIVLSNLRSFYKKQENKNIILPIIKQKTNISLRLLDWLVTNYSEKNNIYYIIKYNESKTKNFNIWLDYKNQLKAYNKSTFDPFCRRTRIYYELKTNKIFSLKNMSCETIKKYENKEEGFVTTVGQLNFFKWAIENRVINYASENISDIESDMLSVADKKKIEKLEKQQEKQKKTRTLKKSNSIFKKHYITTEMKFIY